MNQKNIITGIVIIVVAVIIFFIAKQVTSPGMPDEQEGVTCGTKTVYRYKYPSRAFPIIANDYNAEVNFATDVLNKILDSAGALNIGIDIKNKVVELQEKLNQDNITFSTGMRNYFFSVNSDPCNDTLRLRYAMFTEEMSRRMLELRSVTAQVTTITNKGTKEAEPGEGVDSLASAKIPDYKLSKDTLSIKSSILKLTDVVKKNEKINSAIINRRLPK